MPMLIVDEKSEIIFYTYNSSTSSSICLTRSSSSTGGHTYCFINLSC